MIHILKLNIILEVEFETDKEKEEAIAYLMQVIQSRILQEKGTIQSGITKCEEL